MAYRDSIAALVRLAANRSCEVVSERFDLAEGAKGLDWLMARKAMGEVVVAPCRAFGASNGVRRTPACGSIDGNPHRRLASYPARNIPSPLARPGLAPHDYCLFARGSAIEARLAMPWQIAASRNRPKAT